MSNNLAQLLGIKHPIIMAPMFLVSNEAMIVAALEAGITAAFPALNYRTEQELQTVIKSIKQKSSQPFGVNLIVNKSNFKLEGQLRVCLEENVAFVITSLGSPFEVIQECKKKGIKVFCDVVDLKYALKVEQMGADGVIAVNSSAGGHCGNLSAEELIKNLQEHIRIPIISAGGVAKKADVDKAINLGAAGVSVGTVFIATHESPVSQDYKNAMIQYGSKDIVLTSKLSGSHLTVINTPYVQSLGTKATFLERLLKRNKWLKKYLKLLIAFKGMKSIEKAAFGATYKTVWCAGPSIESVHEIKSVKEVVKQLTEA